MGTLQWSTGCNLWCQNQTEKRDAKMLVSSEPNSCWKFYVHNILLRVHQDLWHLCAHKPCEKELSLQVFPNPFTKSRASGFTSRWFCACLSAFCGPQKYYHALDAKRKMQQKMLRMTYDVISLDTREINNSFVCLFMQNTLEVQANANVNLRLRCTLRSTFCVKTAI